MRTVRYPGALRHVRHGPDARARFKRVVFAATDPKTGVAGSVMDLFASKQLNHHTHIVGGVLADASSQLLKQFLLSAERRSRPCAMSGGGRFAPIPCMVWMSSKMMTPFPWGRSSNCLTNRFEWP